VAPEAKRLCEVTKFALDEAIKICKPGVPYKEIGRIIQGIADKARFGVVREYVGHGVGRYFHSAPTIVHYKNNNSGMMKVWETFTIEPMIVQVKSYTHN
jgi:methionyl aminopeptidase